MSEDKPKLWEGDTWDVRMFQVSPFGFAVAFVNPSKVGASLRVQNTAEVYAQNYVVHLGYEEVPLG